MGTLPGVAAEVCDAFLSLNGERRQMWDEDRGHLCDLLGPHVLTPWGRRAPEFLHL